MESEEVDIFVIMEDGKKYTLEIAKTIHYIDLMQILKKKIVKHNHFQVNFNGKKYTKDNKNDILNFNQGDIIDLIITVIPEGYNTKFHLNEKVDESDTSVVELSGILQLCLLKNIAKNMNEDEINKISQKDIKNIIEELKEEMDLTDEPKEDIKTEKEN